jgi:ketosteroid isomerase-like protein
MSEENVEIVRRMNQALNRGNPEVAVPLLDPDVEWEENNPVWPGLDSVYRGHTGVARWLKEAVFEPWQSFENEVLDYTDLGDHVLMLSHLRGKGRWSGIEVDMPIYNLFTMRGDKIVRRRIYQDRDAALKAAGQSE